MNSSKTLELDKEGLAHDIPASGSAKSKKPEFIVPPGLRDYIPLFEAHYDTARKMPIMVVGATGVGKSLFLHLFENLFKEKNKSAKVVKTNCANMGGGDHTLARSELFGYIKGAFTDAKKDTPGLIEEANGGALILDEIGELPPGVQSMLLTFIETGKYRRVGDPKERSASVTIIGATNNEGKLNEPFRERFYIFCVPPLHQRRIDVLYYLWWLHPETIKELMHWEVLALLAHNWPANVREIDKVGRFLKRKKRHYELSIFPQFCKDELPRVFSIVNGQRIGTKLMDLDKAETSFDPNPILSLYQRLKKGGVEVKILEKMLNSNGVGLESARLAFPTVSDFNMATYPTMEARRKRRSSLEQVSEISEGDYDFETLKRFDVLRVNNDKFNEAYDGYKQFCHLLFQDVDGNQNNVIVNKCTSTDGYLGSLFRVGDISSKISSRDSLDKYKTLKRSILNFLTNIEIPSGREIPDDSESREAFCLDLLRDHPSNPFLASLKKRYRIEEKEEGVDIWSMKYDEFLRYYYEGLIKRTGGNKREAANRIGVNYQTFNSRFRNLFMEGGNSKKQAK